MQHSWKDYLYFSKAERGAVVILIVLIGAVIFLPYYFPKKKFVPPVAKEEMADLFADSESSKEYPSRFKAYTGSNDNSEIHPFYFDPNTLSETGLEKLGLRKKLVSTILKYRNAGGKFYKPGDIKRIYGIKEDEVNALLPFINIIAEQQSGGPFIKNEKKQIAKPVELNSATTEEILALPWPDKRMAYRLINYREKTGGFYTVNEVKQVYGMTDSLFMIIFPFLKIETAPSKKINLNMASVKDLQRNPFVTKEIAEAIIIYRKQHRSFNSVEDLKKIVFITDDVYKKIVTYLEAP